MSIAWALALPVHADENLALKEQAALRAAVERVADSVVQIRTVGGLDTVEGAILTDGPTTGLIVSPDGYVVSSAFNFIQQPASVLVTLPSGKQMPAELVATDHSRMTVLLKVNGVENLPVPVMAPRSELRPGQWAVAVGRTFRPDRVNVSVGIISATNRMFGRAVQTDADVSTASYGGPLVDIRGRVIGILVPMAPQATSEVAGAEWYDSGIGFAVPLEPLAAWIERMRAGEDLHPGTLGIALIAKNPHSARAELAAVRPGSPAGKQGLKKGDVIVEVDGSPIENQTDLRFALGPRYSGDTLRIVLKRGEERLERSIELAGELPPYRHAFLGILPARSKNNEAADDDNDDSAQGEESASQDADATEDSEKKPRAEDVVGISVRATFPGKPAEKAGVRVGDILVRINGSPINSIDDAMGAMTEVVPGSDLELELQRAGKEIEVKVTATSMPSSIPASLELDDAPLEGANATGEVKDLKLPEFPNKCNVYVPAASEGRPPMAMLLWLHAPGDKDPGKRIADWREICDRDNLLLVVPSAAKEDKWELTELEYLQRLVERVATAYRIDSRRTAVMGQAGGGSMAWLLGFAGRDFFRGIATSAAPLPRQAKIPSNEPSHRLMIFAAIPSAKDAAAVVARGLERVSEAGYPVSTITGVESNGKLSESQRAELARWIDTLDAF